MTGNLSSILTWGTIATSALLFTLLWWRRWMLVKPSFITVLFFHLTVQWGAVFLADEYLPALPVPAHLVALILGFPVCTALLSALTFRRSARSLLRTAVLVGLRPRGAPLNLMALVFLILGITVIYLLFVPPRLTGLYAIIFRPGDATIAREEALALLPHTWLRYAVSAVNSSLAPLVAVIGLSLSVNRWQRNHHALPWSFLLLGFPLLMMVVSLSGARAPAGMLVLHTVFAVFLLRGFPLTPLRLVLAAIIVLMPPMMISLLRNADGLSVATFLYHFGDILDRTAARAAQPAFWNVLYAQEHGLFGVSAIPKLAMLFGQPTVDQFNQVYLAYNPDGLESGTANTAVVFAYYGAFGLIGLPVAVGLTLAADGILPLLRKLSLRVRIPCLSVCCIAATQFAATSFTTVLVTHGFLLSLMVGAGLDLLFHLIQHPGTRCPPSPYAHLPAHHGSQAI